MKIPVYVINLDRRPDRLKIISETLDRMGIEYKRISAVDANDLAQTSQENEKIITGYTSRSPSKVISIGDEACALSHFKVFDSFLKSNSQFALILEDDPTLASDLPQLLASTEWIPSKCNLINLEVGEESKYLTGSILGKTPSGRELREIYRFQYGGGTSAYIISKRGASIAAVAKNDMTLQISHLLLDRSFSKIARKLRPVQIYPAMARQKRIGDSDIAPTADWSKGWKKGQKSPLKRLQRIPFRVKLYFLRLGNRVRKVQLNFVE